MKLEVLEGGAGFSLAAGALRAGGLSAFSGTAGGPRMVEVWKSHLKVPEPSPSEWSGPRELQRRRATLRKSVESSGPCH